ncbi:hypothetical protein [Streptomyces tremellae]|uniref:hypothetical protein n=1 Tax=Streptomyces tremellae TaxID=1124239 RepID=UPI0031E9FB8A
MCDQPPDTAPEPATPPHSATTVERGAFCSARCACGWRGPARRSRDLARTDARTHETTA